MSIYLTDYEKQSPKKVIKSAWKFAKTYDQFYQSPKSAKKKQQVDQFAKDKKQRVIASVERQKHQQTVFRTLQMQDAEKRRKVQQKLQKKYQKANKLTQKNIHQREKRIQRVHKHVNQVTKKFHQNIDHEWQTRVQKFKDLQDDKIKYFEQKMQRRKSSQTMISKKAPIYIKAQQRIQIKLKRAHQFSRSSQKKINSSSEKSLKNRKALADQKLEVLKKAHQHKYNTLEVKKNLSDSKQRCLIHIYAKDLQACRKAAQSKHNTQDYRSKQIQEHFKKKVERWSQQKKRIDEKAAEVPQRCENAMNRTVDVFSYRKSLASSFNKTMQHWRSNQKRNQSTVEKHRNQQYEKLMEEQEDQTLRNKACKGIEKDLESMRLRAVKLTNYYL